jgi:hypothetical protein
MPRLIEIPKAEDGPPSLTIAVGDCLLFRASGGRIAQGGPCVELCGPFFPAFVAPSGEVISPQGSPDSVLVLARAPGPATLEIFRGDAWRGSHKITVAITVVP